MARTTCIRSADWVVAWDAKAGRHKYLRGADVAFSGDGIVHVGGRYAGAVDREIDGARLMVMPGLINVHTHTASMPLFKGVREELGNPRFYMSALYDGWNLFYTDMEDRHWNARYAYCEMLLSGTTTVVDMCYPFPGWIDAIGASGIPVIRVLNKIDRTGQAAQVLSNGAEGPSGVAVSAMTGEGIDQLLEAISARLAIARVSGWIELHGREARLRAELFDLGAVSEERIADDGGWRLHVDIPLDVAERLARRPGREGFAIRELLPRQATSDLPAAAAP